MSSAAAAATEPETMQGQRSSDDIQATRGNRPGSAAIALWRRKQSCSCRSLAVVAVTAVAPHKLASGRGLLAMNSARDRHIHSLLHSPATLAQQRLCVVRVTNLTPHQLLQPNRR